MSSRSCRSSLLASSGRPGLWNWQRVAKAPEAQEGLLHGVLGTTVVAQQERGRPVRRGVPLAKQLLKIESIGGFGHGYMTLRHEERFV